MAEWDLLNWQAMIIELAIAGGLAIILSMYFYRRQKRDQESILKLESQQNNLRLEATITRIRSHLATMQGLFQQFLDAPKATNGLTFVDSDIQAKLDLKNEEVELLQNVVNQTSDILNVNWVNRLNDLCILIRKNPEFPYHLQTGKLNMMICDSCNGIISQIKDVMKSLPNPHI